MNQNHDIQQVMVLQDFCTCYILLVWLHQTNLGQVNELVIPFKQLISPLLPCSLRFINKILVNIFCMLSDLTNKMNKYTHLAPLLFPIKSLGELTKGLSNRFFLHAYIFITEFILTSIPTM
jgi:hypothetical protein